jgi:surfactin synthase thioesterase subunit
MACEESVMTGSWLIRLAKASAPDFDIVCLPWAGGGAGGFHSFKTHVAEDVSLWAVAPPGRQQRLSEPHEGNLDRWIEAIGREVDRLSGRPVVLFGHSFGAMLAFEVAHWLRDNGRAAVKLICVSSRRAPGVPSRVPQLANAPDDELILWMRHLGGSHNELLGSEEMLDLVLPPLRDDLALDVAYRPRERDALDIPILALAGRDDPILDPAEMSDWRSRTTGQFELHILPGGHFHLHDDPECVLQLVRRALKAGMAPGAAASASGLGVDRGQRNGKGRGNHDSVAV